MVICISVFLTQLFKDKTNKPIPITRAFKTWKMLLPAWDSVKMTLVRAAPRKHRLCCGFHCISHVGTQTLEALKPCVSAASPRAWQGIISNSLMSLSVCSTSQGTSPTNLEQSLVFTWLHKMTFFFVFSPKIAAKAQKKNIYINRFQLH